MTDDLSPAGILKTADAAEPWLTAWSDPVIVDGYFKALSEPASDGRLRAAMELQIVWPSHWRSGVLAEGATGVEEVAARLKRAGSFDALLDALFDEFVDDACLLGTDWFALIPREKLDARGRGIALHAHPARVQDHWIPWQWWRPFLSRLEKRLGLAPSGGQKEGSGELAVSKELLDFSVNIALKKTIKKDFSLAVEIGRTASSREGHCVVRLRERRA